MFNNLGGGFPWVPLFGNIVSTTIGCGVLHMFGGRVADLDRGMKIPLQGSNWVNWLSQVQTLKRV